MSDKKFNFNLGNRSLTAEESTVVENAMRQFRESLERHRRDQVAQSHAIFEVKSKITAIPSVDRPRGTEVGAGDPTTEARRTDASNTGSASWRTNKVAPVNRRY